MLHVKYVKSCIGYPERQKRTLRALGLKRLGDQVEVPNTGAVQGMIQRVSHLVDVSEQGRQSSSGRQGSSGRQEEA
jgi:large subunit ribosomal protein L30